LCSIEILATRVRSELPSNLQYEYEVLIDYRKHEGFSILVISIAIFLERCGESAVCFRDKYVVRVAQSKIRMAPVSAGSDQDCL
jgi:hypothetical protein